MFCWRLFYLIPLLLVFTLCHAQDDSPWLLIDNDSDRMDDQWEIKYGFDASNPKDAWGDWDGDQILNIHEFYLGSSPINSNSPQVVEMPDKITQEFIDELLFNTAPYGRLVLRFRDGIYEPEQLFRFDKAGLKLLLQGGWSPDFKEYNPEKYKTIFDGGDGHLSIRFKAFGFHASFIIDAVTLVHGTSPVYISGNGLFVYVGITNSNIIRTLNGGTFGAIQVSFDNKSVIDIVNTNVSRNATNGIRLFGHNKPMDCRIINSTFSHHNAEFDHAIYISSNLHKSILNIDIINSIFFSNGPSQFRYFGEQKDQIKIRSSYSNIEYVAVNSDLDMEFIENNINENPLFIFPENNNFELWDDSPCIDQGIDVGLPYNGTAPDMGAFEFGEPAIDHDDPKEVAFKLFPTPTNGQLYFDFSLLSDAAVNIDIFNSNGIRMRNVLNSYLKEGDYTFKIDASLFPSGIYFAEIQLENSSKVEKFIVRK